MKNTDYSDTPKDVAESLDRSVEIPNFAPTPDEVAALKALIEKEG